MAKKKDPELGEKMRFWNEMRDETVQAILAIFSFLITLLSLLAAFHRADGSDLAGPIGYYGYIFFTRLFGVGYFLIPIVFTLLSISFLRGMTRKFETSKIVGSIVFFLSALGLISFFPDGAGGVVGHWISAPLIKIMDIWATGILLSVLVFISVLILLEAEIDVDKLSFWRSWAMRRAARKAALADKRKALAGAEIEAHENAAIDRAIAGVELSEDPTATSALAREEAAKAVAEAEKRMKKPERAAKKPAEDFDEEESSFPAATATPTVGTPRLKEFTPPPLTLLEKDKGKPETGDIKANANIIKRTLQTFSISVEMDEISVGPSVTRYALKPAEGVKLSKIVALNNDLALALAAHPIRIEAPIPGKSLVGIEVPNTAKTTVGLATLLASSEYQDSEKPLLMSLGKDITGKAHFANLAKAPHMLIAGATGSGKSVTIHTLITSLLYRNSPENLKFIMIDPKRVELTLYNKTPHLLVPVITDPKKAILALKWAGKEMSRRYDVLEKNQVRDIGSYHSSVVAPAIAVAKAAAKANPDAEPMEMPETMPYIAIIIDELADIMQTYPRELEAAIVRLAQMSRAVGIHLVLSTQRPSVNVITGLIKANVPTRVALQVASQIDSRTILDQQGAEKLLGAGDMLYLGGDMSKPVRLQSAYITEAEVKKVVKFLHDEYKDEIMDQIQIGGTAPEPGAGAAFAAGMASGPAIDLDSDDLGEEDEMYETARQTVIESNKASTSFLQRKLGIGYSRAAKLMDILEERGVIGPANGSKAREVIGASGSNPRASEELESAADSLIDAA